MFSRNTNTASTSSITTFRSSNLMTRTPINLLQRWRSPQRLLHVASLDHDLRLPLSATDMGQTTKSARRLVSHCCSKCFSQPYFQSHDAVHRITSRNIILNCTKPCMFARNCSTQTRYISTSTRTIIPRTNNQINCLGKMTKISSKSGPQYVGKKASACRSLTPNMGMTITKW